MIETKHVGAKVVFSNVLCVWNNTKLLIIDGSGVIKFNGIVNANLIIEGVQERGDNELAVFGRVMDFPDCLYGVVVIDNTYTVGPLNAR